MKTLAAEIAFRDAVYRKFHREAREVERQDWGGGLNNERRDTYASAMRDAATMVLQVYNSRISRRRGRGKKAKR